MLGGGWNGGGSSALAELGGKSRRRNVISWGREQNFHLGVGRSKGIEVGGFDVYLFWIALLMLYKYCFIDCLFVQHTEQSNLSLCARVTVKENCASYLKSLNVILIRCQGTKQLTEGESSSQLVLRCSQYQVRHK